MVTVKEERAEQWSQINAAFNAMNFTAAELAMESLEVMIQGEEKAWPELKDFNKRVTEKTSTEIKLINDNIGRWGMDSADADIYTEVKISEIKMRNVKAKRLFLYRLARKYNLFVAGE